MKRNFFGLIMMIATLMISYQCLRFHMYIPIILLFLGLFSCSMILQAKKIKEQEESEEEDFDSELK